MILAFGPIKCNGRREIAGASFRTEILGAVRRPQ
jgi:hypothetical protein